jgi:hypothetical protein
MLTTLLRREHGTQRRLCDLNSREFSYEIIRPELFSVEHVTMAVARRKRDVQPPKSRRIAFNDP